MENWTLSFKEAFRVLLPRAFDLCLSSVSLTSPRYLSTVYVGHRGDFFCNLESVKVTYPTV